MRQRLTALLLAAALLLPTAAGAQKAPTAGPPPLEGRAMATFAAICPGWLEGRPTAQLLMALDKQGFADPLSESSAPTSYLYKYTEDWALWPLNGAQIEFGAKDGRKFCLVSVFSGETRPGLLLNHANRWATTMASPPYTLTKPRAVGKDEDGQVGRTLYSRPGREVWVEDRPPPESKEQFLARKVFSIMLLESKG